MTEKEQELMQEASILFGHMLDDFNSRNLLRRTTLRIDGTRLQLIWENGRHYIAAFNEISDKFKPQEFRRFESKTGLTRETLTYLLLSQAVGTLLVYYESFFKTSLLFFLEEEQGIKRKMTLGNLLNAIEKISPAIGARLKKMIDTRLRNAVAHGTFWVEKDKFCFATDSYLQEVEGITFSQLRDEIKRVSIVVIAFIRTLLKKRDYLTLEGLS